MASRRKPGACVTTTNGVRRESFQTAKNSSVTYHGGHKVKKPPRGGNQSFLSQAKPVATNKTKGGEG